MIYNPDTFPQIGDELARELRTFPIVATTKHWRSMAPDYGVKLLHPQAKLPVYATEGADGADICALITDHQPVELTADDPTHIFRTGLAFEIPNGWCIEVLSRSGHGFKHDVRLANAVGLIDQDYVGEVLVKLTLDVQPTTPMYAPLRVCPGDRIAQIRVRPSYRANFVVVNELSETARGTGGFGSTGVK